MRNVLYCLIFLIVAANSKSFAQIVETIEGDEKLSSRLHLSASTARPKSSISLWIDCYYCSDEMYFDSSETFDNVEVIITELNTGRSFTYCLTNGEASLFVKLNSGTYNILYITEKGVYEGSLDIP